MSDADEGAGFETRAIHAGQDPDPVTGAVVTPISLATTFAQSAVGEHAGFEYARTGQPDARTRSRSAWRRSRVPGAGLAFASGMAAEDAVLRLLGPATTSSSPTTRTAARTGWCRSVSAPAGIAWSAVDLTDLAALDAAWRDETRIVWVETPTNPMLTIVDIAAVAAFAHARGARLVVDNTFATPYLQRPLELGADFVVHSSTKYLGGHSDVVGGFVARPTTRGSATSSRSYRTRSARCRRRSTAIWCSAGVKTLGVRMDRHCENARAIVAMLLAHDAVDRVLYPGLPTHAGHDVAARQMHDFGGMVSFTAAGGEAAALDVVGTDPPVHTGGVPRRGRVADRAPGPDDARIGRGVAARRRPRPRPPVGRTRDRRGPRRRPAGRARRQFVTTVDAPRAGTAPSRPPANEERKRWGSSRSSR